MAAVSAATLVATLIISTAATFLALPGVTPHPAANTSNTSLPRAWLYGLPTDSDLRVTRNVSWQISLNQLLLMTTQEQEPDFLSNNSFPFKNELQDQINRTNIPRVILEVENPLEGNISQQTDDMSRELNILDFSSKKETKVSITHPEPSSPLQDKPRAWTPGREIFRLPSQTINNPININGDEFPDFDISQELVFNDYDDLLNPSYLAPQAPEVSQGFNARKREASITPSPPPYVHSPNRPDAWSYNNYLLYSPFGLGLAAGASILSALCSCWANPRVRRRRHTTPRTATHGQ